MIAAIILLFSGFVEASTHDRAINDILHARTAAELNASQARNEELDELKIACQHQIQMQRVPDNCFRWLQRMRDNGKNTVRKPERLESNWLRLCIKWVDLDLNLENIDVQTLPVACAQKVRDKIQRQLYKSAEKTGLLFESESENALHSQTGNSAISH